MRGRGILLAVAAIAVSCGLWQMSPWLMPELVIRYSPALADVLVASCYGDHQRIFLQRVAEWGAAKVPDLLRLLKSDNPLARRGSIAALYELHDDRAILPLLDRALNDDRADVAFYAASALGVFRSDEGTEALLASLSSKHAQVHLAAEAWLKQRVLTQQQRERMSAR